MNKHSIKSFITSIIVIFVLMIVSYVLTFIIPGGAYQRILNDAGNLIVDTSSAFTYCEGGISFVKFILSPFLVLTSEGSGTLIGILIFLIVLSGSFNVLTESNLMKYMLDKITYKYLDKKYKLLSVIMLLFMALGALIGSFEEVVPMVPICVALSNNLGFDTLTGISISLLAVGCGFASGVFNPFTVGVAQGLANLQLFSGAYLRAIAFILIYILLRTFVINHARKVEKSVNKIDFKFEDDKDLNKGLLAFEIIIGVGVLTILSSSFITVLQDYSTIVVALVFLLAGIIAPVVSKRTSKMVKNFLNGIVYMLPALFMILMASSIRYILEEAKVLDTILYYAINLASGMNKYVLILFIYLIVLVMNFFIASGSAKAFMLIPLIVPLANAFGLSSQLCIVAYAFGDGFSNVFYPTNPALLISLSLANTDYKTWAKHSIKFQLLNLLLTSLILIFGLIIGY